jgi:tRNA A-37 threonylcarbamoyl transferase component Bud32
LPDWTDGAIGDEWELESTNEYRNSVIHFITVPQPDHPIRLVYKVKRSSSGRAWFERNPTLTNEAVRLLQEAGLRGAPVLAIDPDRLIVVTLFIPGSALSPLRSLDWRLDDGSRETYVRIGKGASILESVDGPDGDQDLREAIWVEFSTRLSGSHIDNDLRRRLSETAGASLEAAVGEKDPYGMVHSDLTYANIVVEQGSPGFIDMTFAPGLRGTALAKLVHRLEFTPQVETPAVRDTVRAVVEGYGPQPAGMRFLRIDRLLRMLGSSGGPLGGFSVRRRRALRTLRAMVETE